MRKERLMEIKSKVIEQASCRALVLNSYVIVSLAFSGPRFSHLYSGQ